MDWVPLKTQHSHKSNKRGNLRPLIDDDVKREGEKGPVRETTRVFVGILSFELIRILLVLWKVHMSRIESEITI